ncbi:hypothetical protein LZ31DRAFT_560978 [Colletotrichum somersetense]|nr:hypothetical protein LZ31DRAFT_560978 [Colletotrichum somersetense]
MAAFRVTLTPLSSLFCRQGCLIGLRQHATCMTPKQATTLRFHKDVGHDDPPTHPISETAGKEPAALLLCLSTIASQNKPLIGIRRRTASDLVSSRMPRCIVCRRKEPKTQHHPESPAFDVIDRRNVPHGAIQHEAMAPLERWHEMIGCVERWNSWAD